jgi:hypothetical protein
MIFKAIPMNNEIYYKRKFNSSMTKRVIELQAKGFDCDFILLSNNYLMCLQNSDIFAFQSYSVMLVDQVYDNLSESYKYIHAIETFSGERGVLLAENIIYSSAHQLALQVVN